MLGNEEQEALEQALGYVRKIIDAGISGNINSDIPFYVSRETFFVVPAYDRSERYG